MMVCLGELGDDGEGWDERRKGLKEGEGYSCDDSSEVSNTHTQLLLSSAHSTHNTQSFPLLYMCVCDWSCVRVRESEWLVTQSG